MENGPKLWQEILDAAPPGCYIAGGAVRDWYMGVEPADIDAILPNDTLGTGWNIPEGWNLKHHLRDVQQRDRYDNDLLITDYQIYNKFKLQLITLPEGRTVQDHLASFDLGTTCAYYDGSLFLSEMFMQDMLAKKVTIRRVTKTRDKSYLRAEETCKKYGWPLENIVFEA